VRYRTAVVAARAAGRPPTTGKNGEMLQKFNIFKKMLKEHFMKNVGESFSRNVESICWCNSLKMLGQLFMQNVRSTFWLKNVATFLKNVKTFCNA
jgi:hypothetical protein